MPTGTINTTDHDSRIVRTTGQPARQGYNAQAAVNEHQIIVAAEITIDSPDFGHLEPMVDAVERELAAVGDTESPETVLADPGYWHKQQMENVVSRGIQVLIPPDSGLRTNPRPGWDKGLYAFMRLVLEPKLGEAPYRRRMATVEPVFGQMKFNRGFDRFQRRGRSAVRSEWRLAAATHNLLKLHNHQTAAAGPERGPKAPMPPSSPGTRLRRGPPRPARSTVLSDGHLACDCSFHLPDPGKPLDPRTSLRVPPSCAGDTTERLAAHLQYAYASPLPLRGCVYAPQPRHTPT